MFLALSVLALLSQAHAWVVPSSGRLAPSTTALHASVGVFYGTSTGSTMECAEKIYEAFGSDVAAEPIDVDTLDPDGTTLGKSFTEHDALIVGTPTWNTGADMQRSGTGWDQLYHAVATHQDVLKGKNVAVFGLGDQVSYSENFADATGELFDAFESIGCNMMGLWSQEGYEHEESKSIRGDKFCGLLLDMVNQEELTDDRIKAWVAQLISEGFVGSSGGSSVTANAAPVTETVRAPVDMKQEVNELDKHSDLLDESIGVHSSGGYIPYTNPVKRKTMWVSADGRSSFVTEMAGGPPSKADFSP
mmetsp:Transcript_25733/g.60571  ORF Transcript_25733/g.60571 Transcript_25733/m.60571 type:complete len:304 (-) Transcript_25733:111-1022(-)